MTMETKMTKQEIVMHMLFKLYILEHWSSRKALFYCDLWGWSG